MPMFQDLGIDGENGEVESNDPIPIQNVNGNILKKVGVFLHSSLICPFPMFLG